MMEWQIWIGAGVLDMDKGRAMDGEAGNMAYFSKWEVVPKMLGWGVGGGVSIPFFVRTAFKICNNFVLCSLQLLMFCNVIINLLFELERDTVGGLR